MMNHFFKRASSGKFSYAAEDDGYAVPYFIYSKRITIIVFKNIQIINGKAAQSYA